MGEEWWVYSDRLALQVIPAGVSVKRRDAIHGDQTTNPQGKRTLQEKRTQEKRPGSDGDRGKKFETRIWPLKDKQMRGVATAQSLLPCGPTTRADGPLLLPPPISKPRDAPSVRTQTSSLPFFFGSAPTKAVTTLPQNSPNLRWGWAGDLRPLSLSLSRRVFVESGFSLRGLWRSRGWRKGTGEARCQGKV